MRLVYFAFCWTAGILLAANFSATLLPFWGILALAGLVALLLLRQRTQRAYRRAGLLLAAFALGAFRFALLPEASAIAQYNNTSGLTLTGTIIAEPDIRDDRVQVRVEAAWVLQAGAVRPVSGLVLVETRAGVPLAYGDWISATGLLVTPAEFDTFSYADFLARSGIYSMMPSAAITPVPGGQGDPLTTALFDLKAAAQAQVARFLPEPAAGLLTGILFGNERGIAPEVGDAFNAVGAAHIVAISGFNMVVLSAVVSGLLKRVGLPARPAALLGIAVIALYTVFVGANAAVVRAALMSALLALAPLVRRKTYVAASLALVALLLSAVSPTVLWDISFQLSFFAVLSLALFANPLTRWFDAWLTHTFPRPAARTASALFTEPLIVTLAAQILTLPLVVLYFNRLSLLTLPVNLLIVPVQGYILILGLLAVLLAFVLPALAQLLFWAVLLLLDWTLGIVRTFARLPFADVEFYVDSRLVTMFFLLVMGGAVLHATQPTWALQLARFLRRRAVIAGTLLSALVVLLLTLAVILSRPDGRLHLWVLDVGHSNALLLQTPGGAHMLVDGGRYPSRLLTAIGDRLPFYDRQIEMLVITKPDEFTFGALPAVLNRYDIGVALVNGQPNLSAAFATLESALSQHDVVMVRAGYRAELDDGVQIEVLHPQGQPPPLGASMDDYVIVLRIRYGAVSLLLTADLSPAGQTVLLETGGFPQAAVLQVPHHGSASALNEDFLALVQPQAALLQSDPANRRGDPDVNTLAMLGTIPVFRTDTGGAIHLWSDGAVIWIQQQE